jgi:Asp/Glu/hydantoin racemase
VIFSKKLQDNINKNVKGAHSSIMSESTIATDRFSVMTPCYDLNRILSGSLRSGIKSRNLMGIIGPEHTMKSSFMVLCMVNAQKQGYKPVIIDTEGGCDSAFL